MATRPLLPGCRLAMLLLMHPSTTAVPRIRPAHVPLLILTGLGFPLNQVAIARLGRRGAALVETVAGALLLKDS